MRTWREMIMEEVELVMPQFSSWQSYYRFASEVTYSRRYVWSRETTEFLDALKASTPSKTFEVDQKEVFWRAINDVSGGDTVAGALMPPTACSHERIKPLRLRAHEGRVNPKGIPCLYVATDAATAVAEIRPTLGAYITLAQMRPWGKLVLVDCSKKTAQNYLNEPSQSEKEEAVWAHMNLAFSQPVNRSDDSADYASTQLLAEVFKDMGYDGLTYRSAFGEEGFNVAFFNPEALQIADTSVCRVTNISHNIHHIPSLT